MIKDDLPRLSGTPAAEKALPAPTTPPAIRAKTGLSNSGPGSGSGSISSPLKESSIADRIYHTDKYITTSDGLFAWPAIKTLKMTDSAGRVVLIEFASPP